MEMPVGGDRHLRWGALRRWAPARRRGSGDEEEPSKVEMPAGGDRHLRWGASARVGTRA